jgi:arginase family enzyme
MTLCDAGDVFTIPANLEKSFDQITRGVSHVFSSGALPLMLGGATFRYDPLPARMVSRRKRLRFVYFDGQKLRTFTLAEAMRLPA